MAHFAKVNNSIVEEIVIVNNEILIDENGVENEKFGVDFCNHFYQTTSNSSIKWIQTSYNNKIRVRYAFPGCIYNSEFDAFIPPKPFNSWVLDETELDWISPLGKQPNLTIEEFKDGYNYFWEEGLYNEDNTKGWILSKTNEIEFHSISTNELGNEINLTVNDIIDKDHNILDALSIKIETNENIEYFLIDSIEITSSPITINFTGLNLKINKNQVILPTNNIYLTYDKSKINAVNRIKNNEGIEFKSFFNRKVYNNVLINN